MPDRSTQRELDKFDALLQLLTEDGATGPGEVPVEHVEAVRDLEDVDREHVREIVQAHREGRGPPERGGPP